MSADVLRIGKRQRRNGPDESPDAKYRKRYAAACSSGEGEGEGDCSWTVFAVEDTGKTLSVVCIEKIVGNKI